MKKIIAITLALALLALLCACGETAEPAAQEPAPAPAAEEPAVNQAPEQAGTVAEANDTPEESVSAAEESAEEAAEEPAEGPAGPTALETALTLVGHDVSELAAAIGEPLDKAYEASCSGPGDDGIWTYDGLTVFTYRENGVETVVDAE